MQCHFESLLVSKINWSRQFLEAEFLLARTVICWIDENIDLYASINLSDAVWTKGWACEK